MATLTQQDVLDLFDRLLPDAYLAPLKNGSGPGYELLQGYAAVVARVSQAIAKFDAGTFILSAGLGTLATGSVKFSRLAPDGAGRNLVLKAGTVLSCSASGRRFITTEDAVFAAASLGPVTVAVRAEVEGWEYNVPGEVTTADGTVLPGEIDSVYRASLFDTTTGEPAYSDQFVVSQPTGTTGGAVSMLEQLGADRGLVKNLQEDVALYRHRIRFLPDTVSLDAIVRTVEALLLPLAASGEVIETFSGAFQTCWNAPSVTNGDCDTDTFVFNDPRDAAPFRNRWLSESTSRAAFIVVVPPLEAVADYGWAYDDTAADYLGFISPGIAGGRRAAGAYDVPETASALLLQGAYDADDSAKIATYRGLYDTLLQTTAAGVLAVIELEGQ